uniref:Putative secreted peptide n=1 Tax=Anopheles braziliensis TaxID=58242 RepID=A0A2M3ZR10_9DIPT
MLPFQILVNTCLQVAIGRIPVLRQLILPCKIAHDGHTLGKLDLAIDNARYLLEAVNLLELLGQMFTLAQIYQAPFVRNFVLF